MIGRLRDINEIRNGRLHADATKWSPALAPSWWTSFVTCRLKQTGGWNGSGSHVLPHVGGGSRLRSCGRNEVRWHQRGLEHLDPTERF